MSITQLWIFIAIWLVPWVAIAGMAIYTTKDMRTLGDIDPRKKGKLTFDIQENGFGKFRVIVREGPNSSYTLKSECDNTFANISQVYRAIEEWKELKAKNEFKLIKTVE
jgi:hypothetical protein